MEPAGSALRCRLILGKFRVTERANGQIKVAMGGSTTMTVAVDDFMDVRAGDLLTLYTEVLYNAQPSPPPVQ